jgi:Fe-S cluster biogenesis protein NfuA/nitrite reductase/ring-hydroxylating ferredoxin subunit
MTAEASPPPIAPPDELATLARAVEQALGYVRGMPIDHRKRALALKESVEAFHKAGLVRIVRAMKEHPVARELLMELVDDPAVYALFSMHGIVRADVRTRVSQVIETVRPYTQSHGGDVELVDVRDETVFVRLSGACNGCSMSAVTLRNGVEEALREQVPEITRIEVVPNDPTPEVIPLVSLSRAGRDAGWVAGPLLASLGEATPMRMELTDGKSLVLIRLGEHVQAFRNACAHLGLPIDGGRVDPETRTLTCPWHGFRFDCLTGECLTAPQAQLEQVPLRVEGGVVHVRPA